MKPLLEIHRLTKKFPVQKPGTSTVWQNIRGAFSPKSAAQSLLWAVDDVTLSVGEGETVGLVGESGCGKSTLVKLITRLTDPTSGNILFGDSDIGAIPAKEFALSPNRARIQKVFQDPSESLNPRFTAYDCIAEPLRRLGQPAGDTVLRARVAQLADMVALPAELLTRFPHQLSGGQKARVGIARAIALNPTLLVLDEPTSALDVSVQAVILHLLADLRARLNMSYLFVSHDLNVVRLLCDRVLVMYLGKIVESGTTEDVLGNPQHPYTQALVSAIPSGHRAPARKRIRLDGEPQSPIDPDPHRCRFAGRCERGVDKGRCDVLHPPIVEVNPGHHVACHYPGPA